MSEMFAIDIETECNVEDCVGGNCEHALNPHQSRITCVGIWSPRIQQVFRDLSDLQAWFHTIPTNSVLLGHNLKWDLKQLYYHGAQVLKNTAWQDTQLLASACLEKVPEDFLKWYKDRRKEENKKLPRGYSHRDAGALSLKTLAPYFLDVEPFWEDPLNHDNDEYVLKDCEYTYRLYDVLEKKTKVDGTFEFYQTKLLPWTKMLLDSEIRGIKIDMELLAKKEAKAKNRAERLHKVLKKVWSDAYTAFEKKQIEELKANYTEMRNQAILKLKEPNQKKIDNISERYKKLLDKALEKVGREINFDSPTQMQWLLRDFFKLDIEVEVRDKETNQKEIKDSTGAEVLQRLALKGRKDINLFLKYRENQKLATSFFPTYRELQKDGVIHASFNPTGTRTGRLSSSDPNLQQVPGDLHDLFIACPGYKLACYDMAAIEARLIAYYTECPILYGMIKDGTDLHGFHTCLFFDLECDPSEVKKLHKSKRDVTKNIGFGLYYGAGYKRIQQEAMKHGYEWSDRECRYKLEKFRETYESVFKFKAGLDKHAENNPIVNLMGRKFSFESDEIYMKTFNTLIQSSASDMVLESALRIQQKMRSLNIDTHNLLYVHDELVIEVPENHQKECEQIISDCMTQYGLTTALGPLELAVEGQIASIWKK